MVFVVKDDIYVSHKLCQWQKYKRKLSMILVVKHIISQINNEQLFVMDVS